MLLNNFILIFEYFFIKWKSFVINIFITAFICWIILFIGIKQDENSFYIFASSSIDTLGILLGFTSTMFTVLLTIDNDIIKASKLKKIKTKLYKDNFSLFDSLIISFAFQIIFEGFLLIANFSVPLININSSHFLIADISLIILMILSLINVVLEFYFVITKKII